MSREEKKLRKRDKYRQVARQLARQADRQQGGGWEGRREEGKRENINPSGEEVRAELSTNM